MSLRADVDDLDPVALVAAMLAGLLFGALGFAVAIEWPKPPPAPLCDCTSTTGGRP